MRTLRTLAIIPAALLVLAACGDDDSTADTTSAPAPATVQIDVVVGVDSGPDRVETVGVGTEVTLTITNPNAADEFHVHVIDIEKNVAAGDTATFTFVVDTVGEIEVESHITEDVLLVIDVV